MTQNQSYFKKNSVPWNKGMIYSVNRRKKMSKVLKNFYQTDKGRLLRKKLSILNSGKNHPKYNKPVSNEIKKKIKEKNIGKVLSKETKEKLRLINLGKKHSDETRKKMSKSHKGLNTWSSGKNSHFWRGGISKAPYSFDFTRELKELIRKRDNYCCQICRKIQEENMIPFPVHHIDYDKKNSNPINLITLCFSCHSKTNHNRNYWIKYFYESE